MPNEDKNGTKLKKKHIGHKYLYSRQATMALNIQPSPNGDRPMPTKSSQNVETQHHEVPIVDRSTDRVAKTQRISKPMRDSITPAFPSTHEWITIWWFKVANSGEGMICTAVHPATLQ